MLDKSNVFVAPDKNAVARGGEEVVFTAWPARDRWQRDDERLHAVCASYKDAETVTITVEENERSAFLEVRTRILTSKGIVDFKRLLEERLRKHLPIES